MAVFGVRASGRRVAAVDAYEFPGVVRQRFALQHAELTADALGSVEAAARQWFRLVARHPRARLAMPSLIVDEFRREFMLHTREYVDFRATVCGRSDLPVAVGGRPDELATTFRLARQDEACGPGTLPVLFRVDRDVAVVGGRRYLADCGGRGICHELEGAVCLQHVGGAGKALTGGRWDFGRGGGATGEGYGPGCGGSGSGLGD